MGRVDCDRERDVTLDDLDANVVVRPGLDRLDGVRVSAAEPYQQPVASVWVLERRVRLPWLALDKGFAALHLTREAHVGMKDYAEGVGLVLGVLAEAGLVRLLV